MKTVITIRERSGGRTVVLLAEAGINCYDRAVIERPRKERDEPEFMLRRRRQAAFSISQATYSSFTRSSPDVHPTDKAFSPRPRSYVRLPHTAAPL